MNTPIYLDLYCDEYVVLNKIVEGFDNIELEYVSGLSGLEIIGTLIIPSAALCLQVVSFIQQIKEKEHKSISIKKIEINLNNHILLFDESNTENELKDILQQLIDDESAKKHRENKK